MVSMLTRIRQWKQNELTQLNLGIKVTESSQAPHVMENCQNFRWFSENKYPNCSVVLISSCSSLKYLCVISLLPYSIWWFMTNASKAYLSTILTAVNPPMFFLSVLGSNSPKYCTAHWMLIPQSQYCMPCRAGGIGPAAPVLARPVFVQGKSKILFLQKASNKQSASVILGLIRLIILSYNR